MIPWYPDEEWADVPGQAGLYWVSTEGRVLSAGRGYDIVRATNVGYRMVSIARRPGHHSVRVHTLVTQAFLGAPLSGQEVCHRDGDRGNSALANLRYGTRADNMRDMVRHGTSWQSKKTHCPQGHEYTRENTAVFDGRRFCRACSRARVRAWTAKNRTGPRRFFVGHAKVMVAAGDWRCRCGRLLAPTQRLAVEAMKVHRDALRLAQEPP